MDSNVLIDILNDDPLHGARSTAAFASMRAAWSPFVNSVIYAELAQAYASMTAFNEAFSVLGLKLVSSSRASLFRAACAHRDYRARGGTRKATLPDFLIGADALHLGVPLLTRDRGRFKTYFPNLTVLHP